MRMDSLTRFAKLQKQLVEEKSQIETRLMQINQVLGPESDMSAASATGWALTVRRARGGPRAGNSMTVREAVTKALSERGPLSRQELGQAVLELGYKSRSKNVLGSIGNLLYGKNSPFKSHGGKFYLTAGAPAAKSETGGDAKPGSRRRKRRKMSPEARAKIAEAQRARWAKVKRAK